MPEEVHERSRAAQVSDLLRQANIDHETIADLQRQGALDRTAIRRLQEQAAVDRAVIEALADQGASDRTEIANLGIALQSARRIGAAIGVLMATAKVTELRAFGMLRAESQLRHVKVRDIADEVLLTGALGDPRR